MNDENKYFNDLITPYHHIHNFPNNNSIYLGSQSAIGGFPDKWNYTNKDYDNIREGLKKNDIKYVVCCAELYDLFLDDIQYLHIPMESNDSFDINNACLTAWKWIDEKIKTGSVIVHCNAGCHRSATVVVGYLSYKNGFSIEESIEYVKSKRSCINLDNFIPKLKILLKK